MKKNTNTISEAISKVYMKKASKTAMIFNNGNKISYNDMMWDISMTCRVLQDNGIGKNSKVALFMEKSPQCVETFLAVIKTGAIVVLLDNTFTNDQIAEIISGEKPDLIFVRNNQFSVVEFSSSTVLSLDDNRVLRKVDDNVSASVPVLAKVNGNDNAIVTFNVAENGLLDRKCLTHEEFVKMTAGSKSSNPMGSLVNGLKKLVSPLFRGGAVKASV